MPKLKNILIFVAIAAVFVLIYIFFIKPSSSATPTLVSSSGAPVVSSTPNTNTNPNVNTNPQVAQDFLNLLLSVKNIKLNDSIFSDNAFISLHDSSIVLTPDGTEGRPNPFAPIGADIVATTPPTCTLPQVLSASTNTCVTPPPPTCKLPKILNTLTNTCVSRSPN